MSQTQRIRSFFDRIADTYEQDRYGEDADPWRTYFFGERLRNAREMLGDTAGDVLDVGSGPGILDEALGKRVISLDLSPEMLRRSRGPAVAGDAIRLPFGRAAVNTVTALGLTTYLEDLGSFFSECRRVLAPGGRLLFSITLRSAPDTLLRAMARSVLGGLGRKRGVLTAGVRVSAFSVDEASRALERAGFRVRTVRRHNYTVFPFCYAFRGASVRMGRRLEAISGGPLRNLASDALILAERLPRETPPPRRKTRVARIIARMNVGGPARQAIILTSRLDPSRYDSVLLTGRVKEDEGDMLPDARDAGISPVMVEGLGRAVSLRADVGAFFDICRFLLRFRPDVVHTHTAKAGALGRVAAALTGVPVRIHTFHGHVLHGYFGRSGSRLVRAAEMLLARLATRIVAVSEEVRRDLCIRHRVAPLSRVDVVPLGLDLDALANAEVALGELRLELGIPQEAPVVGTVGRVTAVKEPDLMLETARLVLLEEPEARFLVVGGGDLLEETRETADRLGIADRMIFTGWRSDLSRVFADIDVALLTSRNEGTPVALIEAAAAGVPAVATRVGGVPAVVADGVTGLLAEPGDARTLARSIVELLRDPARRGAMGRAARERALRAYSANRLLQDIDRLYRYASASRSEEAHGRGRRSREDLHEDG